MPKGKPVPQMLLCRRLRAWQIVRMLSPMKIRALPQRAGHVLFPLIMALFSLCYGATALAGTLQVRDTASLLSSNDRAEIEASAHRLPFDVRLLTSTAYTDQSSFSRYVGAEVREANEIVIGIDPQHHFTQVHFGTGSHVARGDWPAIERAGNGSFHNSKWAEGVVAIAETAASAVPRGAVASGSEHNGMLGFGFSKFVVMGAVFVGILFVISRVRNSMGGVGPSYGGGGYTQGYGPGYGGNPGGGGMGAVGGGLIGAGLGGIAGYELGKMAGEREGDERHGHGNASDSDSNDNRSDDNFDAGGGGSSWDGGGDSGGGGGDGGGGSDW